MCRLLQITTMIFMGDILPDKVRRPRVILSCCESGWSESISTVRARRRSTMLQALSSLRRAEYHRNRFLIEMGRSG